MENGSAASFLALFVMPYAFALIRVQVTPAAAERQERKRPSERGGVMSPQPPCSPVRPAAAFSLPHEALYKVLLRRNRHCCKVSDEAAFVLFKGLTFQNSAYQAHFAQGSP